MKFEHAQALSDVFLFGAVTVTSAHLGFDLLSPEGLTKRQAKQFHSFILPLIKNTYRRKKDDEAKVKEFEHIYQTLSPFELLEYLLKDEVNNMETMV